MSRSLKRIIFALGGAVGLLLIVALAAPLFVDVNAYKPRLEAAASDALGMDVRISGRLGMGFLPDLHLTVADARILGEQGVVVASAKQTRLGIALLPLLRREVRLHRIELTQPMLSIERDPDGRFNVERLKKVAALLGALDGARVSLSDGTLLYADKGSGEGFEATGLQLKVSRMRLTGGMSPQLGKGLSVKAELVCREIRAKGLAVSALKVSVLGKDGAFTLEPVTMSIFGGQVTGSLRADVSGPVPLYRIHCSLPHFRIEEFLKTLSPEKAAEGAMDFSASLAMQGRTMGQIVQTAAGEVSLRGENLTLVGNDLDRTLSRFESSQTFNLVDVGAVFFAGPLGLAVTKGYNFASLFRGSGGNTHVGTLVSDWRVEHGVAQATDVALATTKNRIALQGGLDFVHGRFADVTVAVVDASGCAKVQQAIRGSFAKPTVEKPRVLTSITGSVVKLYKQTRGLFPAGPCEAFYSGSVAPPS
ncbi:MAG: AsmA family protein [Gemmatimonadales bacterium]|nr:MAG: AsmA family protein [Gemmatimonadales bacterium]